MLDPEFAGEVGFVHRFFMFKPSNVQGWQLCDSFPRAGEKMSRISLFGRVDVRVNPISASNPAMFSVWLKDCPGNRWSFCGLLLTDLFEMNHALKSTQTNHIVRHIAHSKFTWTLLVGGAITILKNMNVNGKDDIPYMKWKNKIDVWNHQPD